MFMEPGEALGAPCEASGGTILAALATSMQGKYEEENNPDGFMARIDAIGMPS